MRDGGRPSSDGGRARRWLAVLLLAAVGVLGVHALRGALVTRDVASGPWRQRADGLEQHEACLAAAADALVVPGMRVRIPDPGPQLDLKLVVDHVFGTVVVVDGDDPSAPTLDVRRDPGGGGCDGAVVELTRAS